MLTVQLCSISKKILVWCYSFLQSRICFNTCKSPIIREGRCNFFYSCQAIIGCKNCNTRLPHFEAITAVCLEVSLTSWYLDLLQTCLLFTGSIQLLSLMYKALFGLDPVYLWNYLSFVFFFKSLNYLEIFKCLKHKALMFTYIWLFHVFPLYMLPLWILSHVLDLFVGFFAAQRRYYWKSSNFFLWLTWRLPS